MFKPRRRGSEDKVGGTFDVTVLEVKAGARITRIDSVLMSQETTANERQHVALGMQRYGGLKIRTGFVWLGGHSEEKNAPSHPELESESPQR